MVKKFLMICLLAVLSVGGNAAYSQAGPVTESSSAAPSAASPQIARLCEGLDKVLEQFQKDPNNLADIGKSIEDKTNELDPKLKLTAADKALLKQTMHRLMETVVTTQMEQNPQVSAMFGSLDAEQKKEMISMAMQTVTKEVDSRIDACETLGDFANIQM